MENSGNLLIRNARLVTPTGVREGDCLIQDGRIAALGEVKSPGPAPKLDADGGYLAPGFLDLHVHGGAGADFSHGDPAAARQIVQLHAAHGTTGLLATIVPGPIARMRRAMAAVVGVPGILGIHLEGPFLNAEKAGALDPGSFLPPGRDAFRRLVTGFEDQIKVVTFAPELPGALDLVPEIQGMAAVPAIGHTAATYDQATAVLDRGARHVTHLGNAMTGLQHRDPGCVGAALLSGASLELILDGIHIHPAFVRLVVEFLRGRGELHRLCLVTDATSASGMPEGSYRLGDRQVRLERGEVRLADGTLAGSALTLTQALRNAIRFANLSLEDALTLVTTNPAGLLGLDCHLGTLAVGARADLVLLDSDLSVRATLRNGEIAF
ncbi:N-acetylglucosamine-6-phosphate deacetylase [Candidatus Bipolaricaulota bacterium]|nr:N-acetylglucosamine-6-phosphate deacetylase [Candidatus Bipolaricaulota bacterium]